MNIAKGWLFLELDHAESAFVRGEPSRRFGSQAQARRQFALHYANEHVDTPKATPANAPALPELRKCA